MSTSPPKGIIFDLDGTLVDSAVGIAGILDAMRAGRGLGPLGLGRCRTLVSRGANELIAAALEAEGQETERLLGEFRAIYRAAPSGPEDLFAGVAEVLETLAARNLRMAVCSNKPQALCEKVIAECGIGERFSAVFGGDRAKHPKPDGRHVEEALAALGLAPGEALYVGDSSIDHAAAAAAGVPFVLAAYGYTDFPDGDPPGWSIQAPPELLTLLDRIS